MILVGWMAAALGVGDLASGGMSGVPGSRRRVATGVLAALLALACGAMLFELTAGEWARIAVLELCVAAPWLLLRVPASDPGSSRERSRHLGALAVLGLGALVALAWPGTWAVPARPWVAVCLRDLPIASLLGAAPDRLLWGLGAVLVLLATSNGIVRSMLLVAGTPPPRGEGSFRGGRYIGAIERLMIFGLAVAGEPTAAALVVSAKSILRFPELTKSAQQPSAPPQAGSAPVQEVDALTEYFLLGSLCSWALALLAAPLVRASFVG
ncbi:MAG TPA: hypothetical protein VMT18_03645 [Planctomycetota bacterium]|nr:hypothetical protein [Planctomycetota bacterium]